MRLFAVKDAALSLSKESQPHSLCRLLFTILTGTLLMFSLYLPVTVCAAIEWPANCIVLIPGIPIAHADSGLKLSDAAPFVDDNLRLQVPLRLIAEELGASVDYQAPIVTVVTDYATVVLEPGSATVWVNGETIDLDTTPQIINGRVYVPLRFIADSLGYITHYRDGVILAGGWYAEPTAEQASTWREGIASRWITADPDWDLQSITVSEPKQETEQFLYYWCYLDDDIFALYMTTKEHKEQSKLMLIADDISYNNRGGYFPDDNTRVATSCFYTYPDAIYALLHEGGATMGAHILYRFSMEDPTIILTSSMFMDIIGYFNDYIYYSRSFMAFGDSYRIHIPSVLAGLPLEEENIAPEGFSYRSCIIDKQHYALYASGYDWDSFDPNSGTESWSFYCLDLHTMHHIKLSDRHYYYPRIVGDWIYYQEKKEIWRMRLDTSDAECAYPNLQNVQEFYVDGDFIVYTNQIYFNQLAGEWQPIWERVSLRD